MQDTLIIEEVDVRRTDDPDDSRVLNLSKVALPGIKFMTADHTPGGGVGQVKFVLPIIEALEPTYSTKGLDRGAARSLGFVPGEHDTWTFAASVRDTENGNLILPMRAYIRGTLASWSPNEHTPGELADFDMAFHEVKRYEIEIDDEKWIEYDYKGRVLKFFGVDRFAKYRRALGI